MAALSKTKKIESLAKFLQKRHKGLPEPPERAVLEHLIYAALLENAAYEQADSAMTVLEHHFIDWNEVRVSTVGELADVFSMLPTPHAAGDRVRRALQGIFEKTYLFDLEDLRKKGKNLSHVVGFLESVSACSRFMIDYTAQVAFGGHVIPLDEASLRLFRLLGLTQVNKERTREEVPGLERAIAKKNGLTFAMQLHHFAACFYGDPESTELRTLLKSIDPEALKRDVTPPALTLVQTAAPPIRKPKAILPVTIPFVASDDDDFDEEHGGTEAEFISDEENDGVEMPVHRGKDSLPDAVPKNEKGKKAKSKDGEKPAKEKKTPARTAATETPPKVAEKKKSPVAPPPKSGKDKNETVAKKKSPPPKKETTVKKPAKDQSSKTAGDKKAGKKSAPEKPSKDSPKKGDAKTPSKSPTRQLREKKPK